MDQLSQQLKIITWNANGLTAKIEELETVLLNEKIDICLISETHLKKDSNLSIKGYSAYHACHSSERARGGSSVFIRENINHSFEINIELDTMQVTSVSIKVRHVFFNIASIYCPPRSKIDKNDFKDLFNALGPKFIIGGDFNSKHSFWGSRCISTKGRQLYKAGIECNVEFFSSGKPTYWPTDTAKTPDLVDFFIARGMNRKYMTVDDNFDFSTDHSAVILTINSNVIEKEKPLILTNNNTNWDKFKEDCENRIILNVSLQTPFELEDETEKFINIVQEAAWNNTPICSKKSRQYEEKIPEDIKELIREKRKARKVWQQSRAPQHKSVVNFLSNKIKNLLRDFKNSENSAYLESLTADKKTNYSLWKTIKGIKKPQIMSAPIRKNNSEWAKTDKEKADLFAKHLEETFKPFDGQEFLTNDGELQPAPENFSIRNITLTELVQEIKRQKNNKAPGYDLINGRVLKELPKKAMVKLLQLTNAALRLAYVPTQWKVAEVIMIPKPGKPPNEKKSYRPISLLPIISKIFEKLLLKRMLPIIEEKRLIPDHQFGFRNNHSTIDQVYRITNEIEKAFEEKKICSTAFLDVSQAFDKVWHDGLKYKLKVFPEQIYNILESYLENRFFRVKQGTEYSEFKEINAGVPQGSVLGPILFVLYTRDIPQTEGTTLGTFADDTAVLAISDSIETATSKLQKALNSISDWTKKWRIALNETKSTHTNFTYKKVYNLPIYINSVQIPYANEAKYLGMTLDAKLKWKVHVKKKRDELENKLRELTWLIGRYSNLSVYNKLLIYKQVLKPVWTYGIQLWGCTNERNIQILQTYQNKVLKIIVNAPWYVRNSDLHRDLNIKYVENEIKKFATELRSRLRNHSNNLIQQSVSEAFVFRRLHRTRPSDLAQTN